MNCLEAVEPKALIVVATIVVHMAFPSICSIHVELFYYKSSTFEIIHLYLRTLFVQKQITCEYIITCVDCRA